MARLIIDTTGIEEGTFPLAFTDTDIGADSVFIGRSGVDIPLTAQNTAITVEPVPEPLALALIAAAGVVGIALRMRLTGRYRPPTSD